MFEVIDSLCRINTYYGNGDGRESQQGCRGGLESSGVSGVFLGATSSKLDDGLFLANVRWGDQWCLGLYRGLAFGHIDGRANQRGGCSIGTQCYSG